MQRRGHSTRRIPTCAVCDARTDRAASHPCPPAQSRKRSTRSRSWRKWRRWQRDGGGSESRSIRRPGRGWRRRSECRMEHASRLHSAVPLASTAPLQRSSSSTMTESPAAGLRRGRTGRHQRVVGGSVRVRWGGEVRSAATRYRARITWRVDSVRAAR